MIRNNDRLEMNKKNTSFIKLKKKNCKKMRMNTRLSQN